MFIIVPSELITSIVFATFRSITVNLGRMLTFTGIVADYSHVTDVDRCR